MKTEEIEFERDIRQGKIVATAEDHDLLTGFTNKLFPVLISWEEIMPVVAKISTYRLAYPKQANFVCDCKVVIYKHILYREVVSFIKFLNSQPKQP